MTPPQWPAGEYVPEPMPNAVCRAELISEIERLPGKVADLTTGLTPEQLDLKFRNWSIRQIVHHLADSHVNAFVRYRLALTEDQPTIKPYDESKWSELIDNRTMDIGPSLGILSAIHARWVMLLRDLTPVQSERTYVHPEYRKTYSLLEVLGMYAHHGRHHSAQIDWVKKNRM